jgi:hypothetical protein
VEKPIIVCSYGGGTQTITYALMAEMGLLLKPDCYIFSDVMNEPPEVYEWIDFIKTRVSVPFYIVTKGNLMEDSLKIAVSKNTGKKYMKGLIPAHLLKPDGSKSLLGRKCTADYKVEMVNRKIKKLLGFDEIKQWKLKHKAAYSEFLLSKKQKRGCSFDAWQEMQSDPLACVIIGISLDEVYRVKENRIPFFKSIFPLVDSGISRGDCYKWMAENGYEKPPRSACENCPLHDEHNWQDMKVNRPESFMRAVNYERRMHRAFDEQETLRGKPFLSRECKPLDTIDFQAIIEKKGKTAGNSNQINLFSIECEGLCGT